MNQVVFSAKNILYILLVMWSFLIFPRVSIAEPIRVVYGFDREFPPFSYEDPGGKPVGFEVELIQALFEDTNAQLFFRPLQWENIPLELSSGTITLTSGMIPTDQRKRLYLFSESPTFSLQIRLFTKVYKRQPGLSQFRGQAVAVEQGSYQHRMLEQYGGINIKTFSDKLGGLRALYNDDVAAFCGPMPNTYYYINKMSYSAITSVGSPLTTTDMRVAVNQGRGDILRMVNAGFARILANGEYDRIYRKWFVRELSDEEKKLLVSTAAKAALAAYAPYDSLGYGAAVLTATGKIYTGCTVENADPKLTLSAAHSAIARAVADGELEIRAAAVADYNGKVLPPSPNELQALYEFGRGILLIRQQNPSYGYETEMVTQLLGTPVIKTIAPPKPSQ